MGKGEALTRCRNCKEPAAPNKARCQKHLDYHRAYNRRYQGVRKEKKRAGICYDCNQPAVPGKTRCEDHLSRNKKGVVRYLKSEKGVYYKETSVELRRQWSREGAKRCKRGYGRFAYVKSNALRAGKEWTISREDYARLIVPPCFYCGLLNDVVAGVGLDRLDNDKGYSKDNVVSCCIDCNYVRGDRFSPEEMKTIGTVIRQVKESR